jgi:hypothetical protein
VLGKCMQVRNGLDFFSFETSQQQQQRRRRQACRRNPHFAARRLQILKRDANLALVCRAPHPHLRPNNCSASRSVRADGCGERFRPLALAVRWRGATATSGTLSVDFRTLLHYCWIGGKLLRVLLSALGMERRIW